VTRASVSLLVVLYGIPVFITFSLSQLGMVRHWWRERAREPFWKRKFWINGIGLLLTGGILVSVCAVKFFEGGWATLLGTGLLVAAAFWIKRHYARTQLQLRRLDDVAAVAAIEHAGGNRTARRPVAPCDTNARTAVFLVNGFNGLGLHTLLAVRRMFPEIYRNFVFVQVGVIDAGNFKGAAEMKNLRDHSLREVGRYVRYMSERGWHAEAEVAVGIDVVQEASEVCGRVAERFPQCQFFAGQLVFRNDTLITRLLHNYVVFELQRRLYRQGRPMLILPIQV
jgi:hypothetical protein